MDQKPLIRAVAYIRVSTDEQADHGISLDAQKARVTSYSKAHSIELVDIIVGAGESAKSLDRPGLQQALEILQTVDALLIVTLDRLTRSVRDWSELREENFADRELISTQENVDVKTASGRFILNILFAKAEFERDQIGERTATAMQHKVSQGEYTGGAAPYGYRLSACGRTAQRCAESASCCSAAAEEHGILFKDEAQQLVIAEARKLRESGVSLREVALRLAAAGHVARKGKPFAPTQIARILGEA